MHTSINEGPRMDIEEAKAESPVLPPAGGPMRPSSWWWAATRRRSFHRQSDYYCAKFATAERPMERYDVPGADHMGELDHLADDGSVFFEKSMRLITSAS